MKKNASYFLLFTVLVTTIVIFKNWFWGGLISAGDFGFYYPSMYSNHPLFPYAWFFAGNSGLGGPSYLFACINFAVGIPLTFYGSLLHIDWYILERIGFFLPFLFICAFSTFYLTKRIFSNNKIWLLVYIIFTLNTYILTVVSGGQIILALSYALCPFAVALISEVREESISPKKKGYLRSVIILSFVISLQILFDLRIGYVTITALIFYTIIMGFVERRMLRISETFFSLFLPLIIVFLVHSFWVLPVLLIHQNPLDQLGNAYTTTEAVKFFSFAKIENTISLLHPNWPENLFGKTYFLRPEFILIPLLAFSSLLFLNKNNHDNKTQRFILFFIILALVGIFLAKGSNEPFGNLYIWLFQHFPGFVLFRDATKWYTLIALAYSVLIPFSLLEISKYFYNRKKAHE